VEKGRSSYPPRKFPKQHDEEGRRRINCKKRKAYGQAQEREPDYSLDLKSSLCHRVTLRVTRKQVHKNGEEKEKKKRIYIVSKGCMYRFG